jgi:hypothetical protein
MKIEVIRDGKWILDMINNKKWTNRCNTCCFDCEFECEQHCSKEFDNDCQCCELDN